VVPIDVTIDLLLAWQIDLVNIVSCKLQSIQLLLASTSKIYLTTNGARCFTTKVVLSWNVTSIPWKVVSLPFAGGSANPPLSMT